MNPPRPRLVWLLLPLACLLPACQQEMAQQPSARPDEPSGFFDDGRVQRPLVAGTVARGHLRTDLPLYTGQRTRRADAPGGAAALVGGLAGGHLFAALSEAANEQA